MGAGTWVWVCAFWKRVKIWQKFKNFWNFETGWTLKSSRIAAYTGCWLTFRKRCEISKKIILQKVKKIQKCWKHFFFSQGGTSLGAPIKVEKIGRSEISYPIFLEFILTLSDTKYRFVKQLQGWSEFRTPDIWIHQKSSILLSGLFGRHLLFFLGSRGHI